MLAGIYRDEWGVDELLDSQVLSETRAIFGRAIDKGVPRSTSHRTAFKERLKASTDVFSAFRVHRQAEDVAAQLVDENGNRRSFRDWAERVQPYLNHQNRTWLQTEYSTAIRRAHDEADWQRFADDADLYPNLEWVPSTSATPGADHKAFWGTVLPVDDAFWSEHRPGDRWNCKCSLRQTDKAPTAAPRVSGKQHEPQAGLRAKPGSKEVFSEDHAYYPEGCSFCVFAKGLRGLMANLSSKAKPFSKDGTCLTCQLRIKCEQKERKEWTGIETRRGSVRIHCRHGKTETRSNTETATYLANKHGYEIDLLPTGSERTADSYNRTLRKEQEYKEVEKATDNAVQMAIRSAKKQADSIVLTVPPAMDLNVLRHALNDRLRRYDNVTDVTIIKDGKDATFTREQITADDFTINNDDFQ